MYPQLLAYAALAAACAWAGWTAQGWRMGERIAALQTEYATAQVRAVEKAHAETIRLQEQADAAARKHAARAAALADDASGTRTALVSLSDAADQALRMSKDSIAACQSNAAALNLVFKSCASELQDMGKAADGWSSEALMLREAWPTSADSQRQ